jgi:hypothetical protein
MNRRLPRRGEISDLIHPDQDWRRNRSAGSTRLFRRRMADYLPIAYRPAGADQLRHDPLACGTGFRTAVLREPR